jgi:D-methionine transport system substrate-binding protein
MRLLKLLFVTLVICGITVNFSACKKAEQVNVVKVGIIDGPDTTLWETAQSVALKKYDLHIKLIKFSDYTLPNEALNNGDIDVNAFQHVPFLNAQVIARGYAIVPLAKTFVFPIALYSKNLKHLSELTTGAKIAIPNDPSNEARALLLLQQGGLIKLKSHVDVNATPVDIIQNSKHLKIVEIDVAQLPRVLDDVDAAVITNDYATPAGLNPKQSLIVENTNSPYMNIIAIKKTRPIDKKIRHLVSAFQSKEVKAAAKKIYGDNAIAGW